MAQNKKPRKDLRARLGRTISPKNQAGGSVAPPPAGVAPPPGVTPPPGLDGGAAPIPGSTPPPAVAPPAGGAVTPPPGIAAPPPGLAAPPPGLGVGLPGGIAAPPFAQPAAAPEPEPEPEPTSSDPFASGNAAPQQQVRLVFDDKPVEESEIGKKSRTRMYIGMAVTLVAGLVLGYGGGSTMATNRTHNAAVEAGRGIYRRVNTAAETLNQAQQLVDQIVAKASGQRGERGVDYEAIEALRALEKPIEASHFTTKNYMAFGPGTVDQLFRYMMNIDRLWGMFGTLNAHTSGEARREELNRTVEASGDAANTLFGLVPRIQDNRYVAEIVYLTLPDENDENGKIQARRRRGGRALEVDFFTGQDITEERQFAMLVDAEGSRGVLVEQTGAFGQFASEVQGIKTLLDETVNIQAQLMQALEVINAEPEVFAL